MNKLNMKKNKESGFTLLELLIVIAIIAILSVALVIVLNPAETLRKARDAQRISDLSTLKTAIGLYMTNVSPVYLGGTADNNFCKPTVMQAGAPTSTLAWSGTPKISYSLPTSVATINDNTLDGSTSASYRQTSSVSAASAVNGTGWIPVDFSNIAGGSPISNIPLDPINTIASVSNVSSADLVYRYGCAISPLTFEIDAQLESIAYTVTDDKRVSDGGNSTAYYETGTNLSILGTTNLGTPTDNTDY